MEYQLKLFRYLGWTCFFLSVKKVNQKRTGSVSLANKFPQ
jgi:hypothetical protein